jgi:hypothetical protein
MGISRIPPMGRLVRGAGGRFCCRECGVEVTPPRRTFCSSECVGKWQEKRNPGHARRKVFERDRGVCAIPNCRRDCHQLESRLGGMLEVLNEHYLRERGMLKTRTADALHYTLDRCWREKFDMRCSSLPRSFASVGL